MNIVLASSTNVLPENAKILSNQLGDFYCHILHCLGEIKTKPVADLLCRVHGLDGDWLIASPTYWQASHNDVMIMAFGEALGLSDEVGRAWFDVFCELASHWHCDVFYHDSTTWLLRPQQSFVMNARPVSEVCRQSIMPHLQALDQGLHWQRRLTEAQLLFSAHTLNQKRTDYPVNGLWFWGGGRLSFPRLKTVMIQDESLFFLAQVLSDRVERIQDNSRYSSDVLLLAQGLDDDLSKKINQKQKHTWYWNNTIYETSKKRRFWF